MTTTPTITRRALAGLATLPAISVVASAAGGTGPVFETAMRRYREAHSAMRQLFAEAGDVGLPDEIADVAIDRCTAAEVALVRSGGQGTEAAIKLLEIAVERYREHAPEWFELRQDDREGISDRLDLAFVAAALNALGREVQP